MLDFSEDKPVTSSSLSASLLLIGVTFVDFLRETREDTMLSRSRPDPTPKDVILPIVNPFQ